MLRHTLLLQACIRARQAVKVGLQYAELPCFVCTYLQDALATQDASRLSWPLCKRRIHHPAAKTVQPTTHANLSCRLVAVYCVCAVCYVCGTQCC